ncbi:MAG: hypothetical protein S4CHLAM37_07290 [Chlamydiia bacterium]|nr:hypothetical protein [Chlamydiia bacterium]
MTPLHRKLCHLPTALTPLFVLGAKRISGEMPPARTFTSLGLTASGSIAIEVAKYCAKKAISSINFSETTSLKNKTFYMVASTGTVVIGGIMLYLGAPELACGITDTAAESYSLITHSISGASNDILVPIASSTLLKVSGLIGGLGKAMQGLGMMSLGKDLFQTAFAAERKISTTLPT